MKPPGWMVLTYRGLAADGKSVDFELRVRKWHPGFWWFVIKTLILRRPV